MRGTHVEAFHFADIFVEVAQGAAPGDFVVIERQE